MKLFLFILSLVIVGESHAIQIFPSGINVEFVSPKKATWKTKLLQSEEQREEKSLSTDRVIRVINSMSEIPEDMFLALVFYNHKNKAVGYEIVKESSKPGSDKIFFIDRNTGRNFQGKLDIYGVPKKAETFALALVNKRGKVQVQNFTHPDFDENGQISIEKLYQLPSKKNLMLQYEVLGTGDKPNVKLGAFHFVN